MTMLEKLEDCPDCGEVARWSYDGQVCAVCGHNGLSGQRGPGQGPEAGRSTSPSAFIASLERRKRVADEIIAGLRGRPFTWGDGEHSAKRPLLDALGVSLLTVTALGNRRRVLKRGAEPVGQIYFAAPIQKWAKVYVMECQTKPLPKARSDA